MHIDPLKISVRSPNCSYLGNFNAKFILFSRAIPLHYKVTAEQLSTAEVDHSWWIYRKLYKKQPSLF